jgi:hypothetical protein
LTDFHLTVPFSLRREPGGRRVIVYDDEFGSLIACRQSHLIKRGKRSLVSVDSALARLGRRETFGKALNPLRTGCFHLENMAATAAAPAACQKPPPALLSDNVVDEKTCCVGDAFLWPGPGIG